MPVCHSQVILCLNCLLIYWWCHKNICWRESSISSICHCFGPGIKEWIFDWTERLWDQLTLCSLYQGLKSLHALKKCLFSNHNSTIQEWQANSWSVLPVTSYDESASFHFFLCLRSSKPDSDSSVASYKYLHCWRTSTTATTSSQCLLSKSC